MVNSDLRLCELENHCIFRFRKRNMSNENTTILIPELSDEQKKELDEQVESFMSSLVQEINETGGLERAEQEIKNIGNDWLEENRKNTLNNDLLSRVVRFQDKDSKLNQALDKYRDTASELDISRAVENSKLKRVLMSLPGVKFGTQKIIKHKMKVMNGRETMIDLQNTLENEINTIQQDRNALVIERKNKLDSLKKLQKISYLQTSIIKKSEEDCAILRKSDNTQHHLQADLIERKIKNAAVKKLYKVEQMRLANQSSCQAMNNILETLDDIQSEVENTIDIALPSVETTMLILTAAESSKQVLRMIQNFNGLNKSMQNAMLLSLKDNEKNLISIRNNDIIDFKHITHLTNEMNKLSLEHKKNEEVHSKRTSEAVKTISEAVKLNQQLIYEMENENEIIRQGLTYVSEIKKQQQDSKENENNKENFNLNKIDETNNNTSTEETNSTTSRFSV